MAIGQVQFNYRIPATRQSPMASIGGDLNYRDTVYVYPVNIIKNDMNEDVPLLGDTPYPIRASVQEQAEDSEPTVPGDKPNRFARLFTRYKGFIKWHDEVIFRGIRMRVIKVLDRFDNVTGQFHHTECRMRYLNEKDSINRDTTYPNG